MTTARIRMQASDSQRAGTNPEGGVEIMDFKAHLRRQLSFLELSCYAYDRGFRDEAIRVAVVLRVLLHESSRSHSLLNLLGVGGIKLLSTVDPISIDESATCSGQQYFQGMVQTRLGSDGVQLRPGLGDRGYSRQVPVKDWWEQIVWILGEGGAIKRRDIVLTAANKDGGAHVDRKLTHQYEMLRHDIGVEFYVRRLDGSESSGPMGGAHFVSLRQMGYEVLHSPDVLGLCSS